MALRRWDEAAGPARRGGTMAPQISNAVEAAIGGGQPWRSIGIDVHKKQSQVCILTEDAELIEKRIRTHRAIGSLRCSVRDRRARILIEASTESEWVARCLEAEGHEVIVADPNYAPMYAQRSRKIKTDRRDARALAEACRIKAYRNGSSSHG